MRSRKHLFPRSSLQYLPENHPLNSSSSSSAAQQQQQQHLFDEGSSSAAAARAAVSKGGRKLRRQPGGFLYDGDRNATYIEDRSYLSVPRKGEGRVWVARRRDMPMGRKRLLLLLRLVKGLQLTDAIDWLQALAQYRCNALINVLLKQQQLIRDQGADASRVYIDSYIIGPAGHVKTMRVRMFVARGKPTKKLFPVFFTRNRHI